MSDYITGRKFVVRTLVLFTDQARTEVLTTTKFYYGQLSGHQNVPGSFNSRVVPNASPVAKLGIYDNARLVA